MISGTRILVLSGIAVAALVGCPPGPVAPEPVTDDVPMRRVIERVNENSRQMDFLLKGSGVSATVKYVENSERKSMVLTGTLLYRKPRRLYLRLQHTWGEGMEVGSNEEVFWVWQQSANPRYWWGEHARIGDRVTDEMPIRPDHLLEVFGLEDLPRQQSLFSGPFIRRHPERYELVFLGVVGSADEEPQRYISKSLFVDRREPFLVREIEHYSPDGHPLMRARLSRHSPIKDSQVLAPHLVEIHWPQREGHAMLEFLALQRFDKPAAERYFTSPRDRGEQDLGWIERVDRPDPLPIPELPPRAAQPPDVTDQ